MQLDKNCLTILNYTFWSVDEIFTFGKFGLPPKKKNHAWNPSEIWLAVKCSLSSICPSLTLSLSFLLSASVHPPHPPLPHPPSRPLLLSPSLRPAHFINGQDYLVKGKCVLLLLCVFFSVCPCTRIPEASACVREFACTSALSGVKVVS